MGKVWVLWKYENGCYESIKNCAVTSSEKAKIAWEVKSNKDWWYGSDEFEMNEVAQESKTGAVTETK